MYLVVRTLVWKHECRAVRKGCRAEIASTLFSVNVQSTSSSSIILFFFSTLIAYTFPVDLCSANITYDYDVITFPIIVKCTFPKLPFPKTLINWKSSKVVFFPVSLGNSVTTSSGNLIGAGTLGNEMDPLDVEGLRLGALEITEDRCNKKSL